MKKPTICIISNKNPVYSETFIRAHIERLPAEVIFLHGKTFPQYDERDRALVTNNIKTRLTRKIGTKLLQLPPDFLETKTFKQILQKNQIQAVLAEYGHIGVTIREICHELGIPLIVHFHGYDAYNQDLLNNQQQKYLLLFQQATAIVAVSRDMQQQLIKLGAPEEKVYYNPYGVDINLFKATQPDQNPPLFLAVGRFVDKKAPFLTVLAFKSVAEKFPQARLKMIGEGQLLETCKRLVQSLSLSEQVEFLGACSHQEVAEAMQTARAFVQHSVVTSYGDSEGTPNGVLEAGASALPVIATRHAGIKDVVIENQTGLLVNEGDVLEMSQQMLTLAQTPELATQLGKAARERIQEQFSMEKSLEQLWSIIEKQIKSHEAN